MSSEYLYETADDMIDAAVDDRLECEEDIFFDAHEDEIDDAAIDCMITPEDEAKARADIAIEDSYEKSESDDYEDDDDEDEED